MVDLNKLLDKDFAELTKQEEKELYKEIGMLKKKYSNYFGVCPMCSCMEWIDLIVEKERQRFSSWTFPNNKVINQLKESGSILFDNDFENPIIFTKNRKDKIFDEVLDDDVYSCNECEYPRVILIPFKDCDLRTRKKVFNMSKEERINFAKGFEVMQNFDL